MKRKIDLQRRANLQEKYWFLRPTDLSEGLMALGFECEDGWMGILEELFEGIYRIILKNEKVPEDFKIVRVEEKFGSLRICSNCRIDEIYNLIGKAESKSTRVCEYCGKKGKIRYIRGWFLTLCGDCFEEKKKES